MSKRPSLQFYPADWQGNSNLRRCSHEEKGIWLDVICLFHDQDEYGICRWPLSEIVQAVGTSAQKLEGLIRKGILKGADEVLTEPYIYIPRSGRKDGDPVTLVPAQQGPIWYSSRMVRDEYVRKNKGKSTRFKPGGGGQGASPALTPPGQGEASDPSPYRRQGECKSEDKGDGSTSPSPSTNISTTTTIMPIPIPRGYQPDPETVDLLRDQGITEEFIDEYLPKFVKYWSDTGKRKDSWHAVFLHQCGEHHDHTTGQRH